MNFVADRLSKIKPSMSVGINVKAKALKDEGKDVIVLKLEIDPKSHAAWTGGKQKILDKGRISKFNKKFQNFRSEKNS